MRLISAILAAAFLLGSFNVSLAADAEPAQPPNFVVVVTSGLKATALGCYDNQQVKTPRLDQLAEQAVLFDNLFVQSPLPIASHTCLMTGRYPQCHGLVNADCILAEAEILLPDLLRQAGYWVGAIGELPAVPSSPRWGFEDYYDPLADADPQEAAGNSGAAADDHPTTALTKKLLPVLKERAEEQTRPFLLWISYRAPHPPFLPSSEYTALYDPADIILPDNFGSPAYYPALRTDYLKRKLGLKQALTPEAIRQYIAQYYAETSLLDSNVGRILDSLDELNLSANTVFIFTSLLGDFAGEHGTLGSGDLYDPLVRVPLIIRFPDEKRRAIRVGTFLEQIDITPTILELAGIQPPERLHGYSLLNAVDKKPGPGRRFVFAMLKDVDMNYGRYLIRNDDWAYIEDANTDREMLFNMRDDPGQIGNVLMIPENQGLVHTYQTRLASRFQGDYRPAAYEFLPRRMQSAVPDTGFPEGVKIFRDVHYANDDPKYQVLDVYMSPFEGPRPVLIEFHGGGFRGGDKLGRERSYPGLFGAALSNGISVVAADYRLRPEYTMENIHADGARVIQFVRANAEKWNLDPSRIALIGSSAGAVLSAYLGLHDDLADPNSDDPIAGISTSVNAIINQSGPVGSTHELITPGDPPVFMLYSGPGDLTGPDDPRISGPTFDPHSPKHGFLFERVLKEAGVPAEIHVAPDIRARRDYFNSLQINFLKNAFGMAARD